MNRTQDRRLFASFPSRLLVSAATIAVLAGVFGGCGPVEVHQYDPVTEQHIADGLQWYREDVARIAGAPSVEALEDPANRDKYWPVGDLTWVEYESAVNARRDHLLYEQVKRPADDPADD